MHWNKALAIINPRAGRWRSEKNAARLLRNAFAHEGGSLVIREVSGAQDARMWAKEAAREGFDCCIVVGGDGTIHEVVNGFSLSTMLPLAILPTGSGNVLAAELGIPKAIKDAVRCVHHGRLRTIDIGRALSHGRCFTNALTVGYGSRIIADARQELKTLFGYPAYILTAFAKLISIPTAQFRCVFDGAAHQFEAQMILVANVSFKSLRLHHIGPPVSIDDGLLTAMVFRHKTLQDLARLLAGIVRRPQTPLPQVQIFSARTIEITSEPLLPVLFDGELCESKAVRVAVWPHSLPVCAS
jgi:YegS/Rv2252/BmrU family lipid kinase